MWQEPVETGLPLGRDLPRLSRKSRLPSFDSTHLPRMQRPPQANLLPKSSGPDQLEGAQGCHEEHSEVDDDGRRVEDSD